MLTIPAECHSDDRCIEVEFDAEPWFENAPDNAILGLAECGWGGDYEADEVAIGMADETPGIADMFTYIELRSKLETIGFECHVNSKAAMKWLYEHRPTLWNQIRNTVEE